MPNNLVFNNVASQLQTQIYGTDGKNIYPIKTDTYGRLEVVGSLTAVVAGTFVSNMTVVSGSGIGSAMPMNTSVLNMYSFFVHNLGNSTFTVRLQVAPTNEEKYYINDTSGDYALVPNTVTNVILVPRYYLNWTRVQYIATAGTFTAEVWFNGKG